MIYVVITRNYVVDIRQKYLFLNAHDVLEPLGSGHVNVHQMFHLYCC